MRQLSWAELGRSAGAVRVPSELWPRHIGGHAGNLHKRARYRRKVLGTAGGLTALTETQAELKVSTWARKARALALGIALTMILLTSGTATATTPANDTFRPLFEIQVPSGRFFTEPDGNGTGFGIRNYANGQRFLDAFERYGGLAVMGYPLSRPWIGPGGFVYQLTQRALMQWSPLDKSVRLANLFEVLRETGLDDTLYARSIPRSEHDASATFDAARRVRMRWLTDPAITREFVANRIRPGSVEAGIELHGLPMSRPETFGPFVVQRFQRTAIQHWVEQVDGGLPVGTVVLMNSGYHYKDLLLQNSVTTVPHAHEDARMVDQRSKTPMFVDAETAAETERNFMFIDDVFAEALRMLESVPAAGPSLDIATATATSFRFRSLPARVVASFTAPSQISINHDLSGERIEAIAAVIAHELQHLSDFHNGVRMESELDCLEAEVRAVITESIVWSALAGPDGLEAPLTALERMENARLDALQAGYETIRAVVEDIWGTQCAREL